MLVGGGMGAAGVAMFAIGYFLGNPPAAPNNAPAPQLAQAGMQQAAPPSQAAVSPAAAANLAPTASVVAQQTAEPTPSVAPAKAANPTTLAAENDAPPPLPQPVPEPAYKSQPADLSAAPAAVQPSVIQPNAAKLQTSQSAITPSAPPLIFAMAERPAVPVAKVRPPAPQPPVSTETADAAAIATAHLSALLPTPPAAAPAPPAAAAAPAPAPDSDSLNQAEQAKLSARQKVAIEAPPVPTVAGPTRGFTPRPLEGGAPSYPAAYEGADKSGRVTVKCRIEASGAPTGCQVVGSYGGRAFDTSVLNWLGSGHVRFAPILHNGQAAAETHQWNVNFQPGG
jgi:TonB family protein